ncbi:hypothetical protein BGZ57DRAFT_866798 [Hyaloscypha finlandica]|nr:hypothetical protein BGZ57DRAFT_866798 [Hyaloscypha finlandica]
MFHVFPNGDAIQSAVTGTGRQNLSPEPGRHKSASTALTRSCAECRRRRIKCDSTGPPCGQCSWYKVQGACRFPARRGRNVPSSRHDTFSIFG